MAQSMLGVQTAELLFGPVAPQASGLQAATPDAGMAGGFSEERPLRRDNGELIGVLRLGDPIPRPPLSPAQARLLDDLAATAVQAWEWQHALRSRAEDRDRQDLQDRLLRVVSDAQSFAVAVQSSMAILRDATGAMLCLFFRLDPDGEQMHLVAGQAHTQQLTDDYIAYLRHTRIDTANSLVGRVAVTGMQEVVRDIDHATRHRFPAIGLSVAQRIDAQIVTPLSLGTERYAFSVGYDAGTNGQLAVHAAMLLDLAGSLRPLLRRLRDAEEIDLFRRVMETSNNTVMISAATAQGPLICYVNAAFTRQTGYTPEAVLGRPNSFLLANPDAQAEAGLIAAAQPLRRDMLNRRQDGSEFWVDQTMAPVIGVSGVITHWVTLERDIMERRLAHEAILLNEQRFRLVARATAEVVWDWDLASGTIWWSDGMLEQFGHELVESRQSLRAWSELVHEDDRARLVASRAAAIAAQPAPWEEEYRLQRATGSYALVLDRGQLIVDAEGRPVRMVGSLVDITQRRKLETELRQAQRLEAIGRLTGGVAHDFNNLLAVIMGNAELMRDEMQLDRRRADSSMLEGLEVILHAADRGADLTNRLLAFARLHPLNPKRTEAKTLLCNVEALARRLIGADIEMSLVLPEQDLAVVIDASQLENALLNLCINARDAMPMGGRLRMEAAMDPGGVQADNWVIPPGDYVAISVSDTGIGMTPEVLARAFEPFFTTKDFGKGSGLGLSMVFGFASQSKGHVGIHSAPGQGCRITLYLPRSTMPAAIPAEPSGPRLAQARGCILVVEDDAALCRTVATQLESIGYRVLAAPDAQRALDLVSATPDLDLIFTDLVLPGGIDGQHLAERAKAMRPGLLVLYTSGYPQGKAAQSAAPMLHKPYRITDLAERIALLLRRRGPADWQEAAPTRQAISPGGSPVAR